MTRRRFSRPWIAAVAVFAMLPVTPGVALDRLDFQVSGPDQSLADILRNASLLITQKRDGQTNPQDLIAAARADYSRILNALYARGYYSGVIRITIDGREAATIPTLSPPSSVSQIVVSVDPGPIFTFSKAEIAPLPGGVKLPPEFQIGKTAESGAVGAALDTVLSAWREVGHPKAATDSQTIIADHAHATLSAEVGIAPGPKLRFGPLAVEGETRMREARVRQIAGLPVGETFSQSQLDRSTNRLKRTGIFSSVALVEDDRITAPDLLGITATVVEQKPRRYSFGAEIASLDGLSLTASWLHRNLRGGGERLKVEGAISNIGSGTSGIDYSLGVTLDRPATFTADTTAGVMAKISRLDEVDYFADSVEVGFTLSHVFSDTLTGRAALTFKYQQGEDPGGAFDYMNIALPVGATWDRRDVPTNATKGFYLDAEVKPFLGFGTTGSGARITFDGRAYRSFGASGGLVAAVRAQGGAIVGSGLLDTPRDELFFSGGGGTVRGQPYRSLGVPISVGMGPEFLIGGTNFLAGSVELRAKITEKIGVVGFVDAGCIGATGFFDDTGGWHAGAGLGLRYDTGFGPIRADLAVPVGGSTGDGFQLYIGLGQSF